MYRITCRSRAPAGRRHGREPTGDVSDNRRLPLLPRSLTVWSATRPCERLPRSAVAGTLVSDATGGQCVGFGRGWWRSGVLVDIELADAVAVVRGELLGAAQRGGGGAVAFVVGPIEMEFTVELRADAKAKAGFKAWVLASAEVEAGGSRSRTHTVKVTLTAKRSDGGDLLIAAETEGSAGPGNVSSHLGR